jgi:hypothetical protein
MCCPPKKISRTNHIDLERTLSNQTRSRHDPWYKIDDIHFLASKQNHTHCSPLRQMPFVDCFPLRRLDLYTEKHTTQQVSCGFFSWVPESALVLSLLGHVRPCKVKCFVMCQRRRSSGQVSCSEGYASHVRGFRSLIGHVQRGLGNNLIGSRWVLVGPTLG